MPGGEVFCTSELMKGLEETQKHKLHVNTDALIFATKKTIRMMRKSSIDWKSNGATCDKITRELDAYEVAVASLIEQLRRRHGTDLCDLLEFKLAQELYRANVSGVKISRRKRAFCVSKK